MGVAKAIPSLGAFTPIESMLKGGSSKTLNPMSLFQDTKTVLSKPSDFLNKQTLTGQGKGSAQTFTEQKKQAQEETTSAQRRAWYGTYGNAQAFRDMVDASGGNYSAGQSNVGLAV